MKTSAHARLDRRNMSIQTRARTIFTCTTPGGDILTVVVCRPNEVRNACALNVFGSRAILPRPVVEQHGSTKPPLREVPPVAGT